jgi:hypothetical protein
MAAAKTGTGAHKRPGPAAILLVPVIVALVLTLFAWPSARLEPRDLPIGLAGSPAAVAPFEQRLSAQDGAFDVVRYASARDAREGIEDREVYGAFVVSADGAPSVLVASGASPAVAQLITHAAPSGAPVEDVVQAGRSGSSLGSSVLPLVMAGILTGVLSAVLVSGAWRRGALLVTGSALAGVVSALIVDSWLGVVGGSWALNAGALSLTILAIGSVIAGLKALLGEPGVLLGALTMVLIGNPFSGVQSAPELLPQPVGGLGQLLPPGAGGNLLRSTGFFDGAAAGGHIAVLAAWVVTGAGLLALAALRGRAASAVAPAPAPA